MPPNKKWVVIVLFLVTGVSLVYLGLSHKDAFFSAFKKIPALWSKITGSKTAEGNEKGKENQSEKAVQIQKQQEKMIQSVTRQQEMNQRIQQRTLQSISEVQNTLKSIEDINRVNQINQQIQRQSNPNR